MDLQEIQEIQAVFQIIANISKIICFKSIKSCKLSQEFNGLSNSNETILFKTTLKVDFIKFFTTPIERFYMARRGVQFELRF